MEGSKSLGARTSEAGEHSSQSVSRAKKRRRALSSLELCAGGGGQALGLELAGFQHAGVVEYEAPFCVTLRTNRPSWNIIQRDVRRLEADDFVGVDLVAAGVPCPPFSVAGKQLGKCDERDMFPPVLEIVAQVKPRAVLIENVPGLASSKFDAYRKEIGTKLSRMGYVVEWRLLNASDYGVPQLRPRLVLVGLQPREAECFLWPIARTEQVTVGDALVDLMAERGWPGALEWAKRASSIAPTLVGGSKKHGGPDLGPTRAKAKWKQLGVDGMGIAELAPGPDFAVSGHPRLTLKMVAALQSFPSDWRFWGGKTVAYRQVGNAFPPQVALELGRQLFAALHLTPRAKRSKSSEQHRLFQAKSVYEVSRE